MASLVFRLVALTAALFLALFFCITCGSIDIPWREWIWNHGVVDSTVDTLVEWRVAHAIATLAVGGGLALAGSILQRVLRNPLADPFVLGVTSGSAFFAVLSIATGAATGLFGLSVRAGWALVGAFFSLGLVLLAKRMLFRGEDSYGVPLAGMLLNSFFGAMLTFTLALLSPERLTESFRWLVGDIQHLSLLESTAVALVVLASGATLLRMAPAINALAFGDDFALSLGFSAKQLRTKIIVLCALLIAVIVAVAGSVGFVGLVVPHIARWYLRGELAFEWLTSAIMGATLLLAADILSRITMAPSVIPVGVFTALIGVPLLATLAMRNWGRRYHGA